jgi:pimeloyl-ACP methyl ester carboxylesterase
MPAPHLADVAPTTSRRGSFWIPGERVQTPGGTVSRGPMFVAWEAPADADAAQPLPLVLVHGGGGQGLDYLATPDGRPGWASLMVDAGYAVYVVDRPGHGRSAHHPDVLGPMGPPFPFEIGAQLFAPPAGSVAGHTQWPGPGGVDDPAFEQFMCCAGPMLASLADGHALEAERLARLLDVVGECVLVTHSAGSACGWLAAQARPSLVRALVAIEPMGPPFAEMPGMGPLHWGLTAAPLEFDPPVDDPAALHDGTPRRLAGLADIPVTVVTGEASPFAAWDREVIAFLQRFGCDVERLHLADHGVHGNGHAMMLERNHGEALAPILAWIDSRVGIPAAS